MRDFRTLKVWQRSHALTLATFRLTKAFPRGQLYGLTSQINRAASSIAGNLAEGCGSVNDGEFAQSVRVAARSASELEYHLLLARDLRLSRAAPCDGLIEEVAEIRKMLVGLLKKLTADRSPPDAALQPSLDGRPLPADG